MQIAIINGPNLNLLGKREPDVYGSVSFDDYFLELKNQFAEISFSCFQSNIEGEIVTELQRCGFDYHGIVLNAGAYTHTSVAIGDAVAAIKTPVVEVHISNVYAREEFRRFSYISAKAAGCIAGLGLTGYALAIEWLMENSKIKSQM